MPSTSIPRYDSFGFEPLAVPDEQLKLDRLLYKMKNTEMKIVPINKVTSQTVNSVQTSNEPNENVNIEKTDFEHSVRPIYYLSRVFGLLPFSLVRNERGEVQEPQVRVTDLLYFVISLIWSLFLVYVCCQNMRLPNDNSLISVAGDFLLLFFGLIFNEFIIPMDMFNRFKLVEVVKMFTTFDKNVSESSVI